jgi:hypothetical protein
MNKIPKDLIDRIYKSHGKEIELLKKMETARYLKELKKLSDKANNK